MTGPAASEGMVQKAPAKETKPCGACSLPGRAVGHTWGEEMGGDHAEHVLSIHFEESKWVWKGCLGLGIFTTWYWEEC